MIGRHTGLSHVAATMYSDPSLLRRIGKRVTRYVAPEYVARRTAAVDEALAELL